MVGIESVRREALALLGDEFWRKFEDENFSAHFAIELQEIRQILYYLPPRPPSAKNIESTQNRSSYLSSGVLPRFAQTNQDNEAPRSKTPPFTRSEIQQGESFHWLLVHSGACRIIKYAISC